MSSLRPQNSNEEPNLATMEAPVMRTSFDVVCAASLHRHVTICDIILKTLKKLWPQSDRMDSARQSIVDRTDMMMREYLLKEAKVSSNPKSAECFAERWDYLAWYTYLGWCHLNEEIFPFDFPEYEENHAGPPAPEHLHLLESQTPKESAVQSAAGPVASSAATPPPPPAEDGRMVQGDFRDEANFQWQKRQEARVKAVPEPEVAPALKPHAQDRPVVRPVREDLPQDKQERVLSLKLRQEIWKMHFQDCALQQGAEPLQLQIPRNKRDTLLLGGRMTDGERTSSVVFDRMQSYLPYVIDVIYQDAQDERFGFTLVYIGLKPAWQAYPQAYNSIFALHMAWATLFPWAKIVNEGCNIDVATFAKWHTDNEIEVRRQRTSDSDTVMAEAMDFFEDHEGLSRRAHLQLDRKAPSAPRPKPGQHQAKMTAERRAEYDKLPAIMQAAAKKRKRPWSASPK